jgi:hypothetical protein
MGDFELRTVIRTVRNPAYVPGIKRGLLSVWRFHAGLPLVVYRANPERRNFYTYADLCIDIPVLGLVGINRSHVTNCLIAASQENAKVTYTAPKHERFVVCEKCKSYVWLYTIRTIDSTPTGGICATCGARLEIKRVFHSAGRA